MKKQHEEQANKYKATIEEIKKNKAKVEDEKNAIKKELHKKETQIQSLQAELQKQANASAANEVLEDNLKRAMALIDENREYRTQAEDLMASLFKEYTAFKNKPVLFQFAYILPQFFRRPRKQIRLRKSSCWRKEPNLMM